VLHADDFGMNVAVSRGIIEGFSRGLLTSTSLLANGPAADFALSQWRDLLARLARRDLPSLEKRRALYDSTAPFDLGIHFNLTQGRPLTGDRYPRELLDRQGCFPGVVAVARKLAGGGRKFQQALDRELSAQVEFLLNRGLAPTHANAHQYVDMLPAVAAVVPVILRRYAINVVRIPWERHLTQTTLLHRFEPASWLMGQIKRLFAFRYLVAMSRQGLAHPTDYFGTCHAGRIDLDLIREFLSGSNRGLAEIGLHPACVPVAPALEQAGDGWNDPLAQQRPNELRLLTSSDLVDFLASRQIRLVRLSELSAARTLAAAA
jgi:predicted glycoside hydrolase/deacetylase ChbG (UPF0249 family)